MSDDENVGSPSDDDLEGDGQWHVIPEEAGRSLDPDGTLWAIPCWNCGHGTRPYTPLAYRLEPGERGTLRLPESGDYSVCANCEAVLVFDRLLGVLLSRAPTRAERRELAWMRMDQ